MFAELIQYVFGADTKNLGLKRCFGPHPRALLLLRHFRQIAAKSLKPQLVLSKSKASPRVPKMTLGCYKAPNTPQWCQINSSNACGALVLGIGVGACANKYIRDPPRFNFRKGGFKVKTTVQPNTRLELLLFEAHEIRASVVATHAIQGSVIGSDDEMLRP